jgi:hypothetical protein
MASDFDGRDPKEAGQDDDFGWGEQKIWSLQYVFWPSRAKSIVIAICFLAKPPGFCSIA